MIDQLVEDDHWLSEIKSKYQKVKHFFLDEMLLQFKGMSNLSHRSKHLRGTTERGMQRSVKTDGSWSTDKRKRAEGKDQMTCLWEEKHGQFHSQIYEKLFSEEFILYILLISFCHLPQLIQY